MRAHRDSTPASSSRWRERQLRLAVVLTAMFVLVGACSSDEPSDVAIDGAETPEATTAPTSSPSAEPTITAPPAAEAPTAEPAESAPCAEVPAFRSADTVTIACSGSYAVSPELFASNAGWHLFEASDGSWEEIDYARTCCEADDPSFTDLLERNGLDSAAVAELCAASGLGADEFSGCVDGSTGDNGVAFEPTWLRVNGLGNDDFGTAQSVVLDSIADVFGPAIDIVEATECGAGPMMIASFGDFTVQFQDDAFIGWYYAGSTPELTTPSGVVVGISEADLTVVYDGVQISEGTLGREFFFEVPAGFMAGFISETNATVTALYAGTNCFFR